MADAHGHSHDDPKHPHGAHGHGHGHDHHHHEPAEDPLRTPGWLPLLGAGLLLLGALGVYAFISPGVLSPSTTGDGGADAAVAPEPAAPAAPAAPAH